LTNVESRSVLLGSNNAASSVRVIDKELHLEVEDLLLLLITHGSKVLVLLEETFTSLNKIFLAYTPLILEGVKNISFVVKDLNGTLLSNVLESDDTIGDTAALEDSNPSDLRRVIGVSSTACFGVNSSDVYYSEGVTGHDTTLVEGVAILLLSLSLVHERLGNLMAFINKSVSLILDVHFLLLGESLEVSDIEMGFLSCLFSTSLPNVGS